jgi:hypothetical protein
MYSSAIQFSESSLRASPVGQKKSGFEPDFQEMLNLQATPLVYRPAILLKIKPATV